MRIRRSEASVRKVDDALTIVDLFDGEGFAFDVVEARLSGSHPTVVNKVSDRAYVFLDGDATVRVGDEHYEAAEGDVVVIPIGTRHGLSGEARYLIITSPPFDPENEEVVDD